jgi:LysM repeat protein
MTCSTHEALVRRAVRDHQHSGRVGGGRWVVTTQAPPSGGALGETVRTSTSYRTWLRTTAVTGLAGALLMPSAAAASPIRIGNAPGLPATNPQAVRAGHLETPKTNSSSQELFRNVVKAGSKAQPNSNRQNDRLQVIVQFERQSRKPVSPPQNPPPARQPSAAKSSTGTASTLATPKSVIPLDPAATQELTLSPPHNRVDSARSQLSGQRLNGPSTTPKTLEEHAQVAESQLATPERVDQWVTTVWTAMHSAPKPANVRPALTALAEVSPTPKMGWSYRVQRGDSLWRISTQLWPDGSSNHSVERTWRVLYEWNRDVLGHNSNLIYPGQVLEIPANAKDVSTTSSGASAHPVVEDVAK